MEYYNNKWHGTIKCTPEEGFQQKYMSTNDLKNMQSEDIRTRIVESTKRKGQIANQGHLMEFKIVTEKICKNYSSCKQMFVF